MSRERVAIKQNFRSDPDLRGLAKDIEERRCVVFLGAGASVAAGLPGWRELEKQMKTEAGLEGDYGPLRTADCCRDYLGANRFYKFVEEAFRIDAEPTRLHRRLSTLPVNIFITTNYDTLMEEALVRARGKDKVNILANGNVHRWRDVDAYGHSTWVLKIHGSITESPSGIVIGERDYLDFSENYPHVVSCLSDLFAKNSILFLGYSLSDWNIAQVLYDVQKLTRDYSTNKYFIGVNAERLMVRFFEKNYGLRFLNLDAGDGGAEGELLDLLDQIMKEFEVPGWFISTLNSFGYYINAEKISLNTPLSSIFAGFDSTVMIRLALRIEEEKRIRLPLERVIDPRLDIRQFLSIVEECQTN